MNWSRWATRVLGEGIEASRLPSMVAPGRAGTGTGGISERARVAPKAQMRLGGLEAALEERDVLVKAEIAAGSLVGHGDTRGRGVPGPPTLGGRMPHSGVSVTEIVSTRSHLSIHRHC